MDIALSSAFNILIILVLIVLACVVFTNAIEHLGVELKLSEGAVGSVLAAVGTALPETIVPLVAIIGAYVYGTNIETAHKIGIGGILGAPFLLGTLAFFVTGLSVYIFTKLKKRTLEMPVNTTVMFRDLHYFAISYGLAILASFIQIQPLKYFIAIFLIVIYGVYVIKTIRCPSGVCNFDEDLEILYLKKFINFPEPFHRIAIFLQILLSLVAIIVLAHFFVGNIKVVSDLIGINPLIVSLIITPIATELPEKFNSIIWVKSKKDTLAMGNITGAMVFQSCIPTAVGIALTPWVLEADALVSVLLVYLAVVTVYFNILKNKGVLSPKILMIGGIFYVAYFVYIILVSLPSAVVQ